MAAIAGALPEATAQIVHAAGELDRGAGHAMAQLADLSEAARRTSAVAAMLPAASDRIGQVVAALDHSAAGTSAQLDALNEAARHAAETAISLPQVTERIEEAVGALDRGANAAAARDRTADGGRRPRQRRSVCIARGVGAPPARRGRARSRGR